MKPLIFTYGPPGSGKTTIGKRLAEQLNLPFLDMDDEIERRSGKSIPEIFASEGENGFRQRESTLLRNVIMEHYGVIALGGGALLNPQNRKLAQESGFVVCLSASCDVLMHRLSNDGRQRPLLIGETNADRSARLEALLTQRADHYASFNPVLDTSHKECEDLVWEVQVRLGVFHVHGMGKGYDVWVSESGFEQIGEALQWRNLHGPIALITDEKVGGIYAERVSRALQQSGYFIGTIAIPPGEQYKNLQTLSRLWEAMLSYGVERRSTVIALGGGVVGDLAGFAAATFMRGLAWVVLPTSLLAMVDASLGGKTGIDLSQGKNLVGAFHPPSLVWVDPKALHTLPNEELRNGMAEVVKAGVIGDSELFWQCSKGWQEIQADWKTVIARAMAVKIRLIQEDPYEKERRAVLNFGHTIGHALETLTNYRLRHGEAVAIGMVIESQLAEAIGLAEAGITEIIRSALHGLGLPIAMPTGIEVRDLIQVMGYDKKKSGGKIRFALPKRIGEVVHGVEIPNLERLLEVKG